MPAGATGATEGPETVTVTPAEAFAGDPDGLERLWTPHRLAYIQGEGKPRGSGSGDDCPFCRIPTQSDVDALIVKRGRSCFAVLNLFPYNAGHLMVIPFRHVAWYSELSADEVAEVGLFTQQAMAALTSASTPQGFNIGMNQGAVAGAGVAAHLHQHVIPRWAGDTNFMPIVARTRVLPELLGDVRDRLAAAWPE
jgi:ATP adenylyltransferase